MKAIIPIFDKDSKRAAYLQLYDYIKAAITSGEMKSGEKLPSLRSIAGSLKISLTTAGAAYDQLAVEGYIYARAGSGYYVNELGPLGALADGFGPAEGRSRTANPPGGFSPADGHSRAANPPGGCGLPQDKSTDWPQHYPQSLAAGAFSALPKIPSGTGSTTYAYADAAAASPKDTYCDLSCFDFVKWKKCINKFLNEHPEQLLFEGDPQGEEALRLEIARYLYLYRGVSCMPSQIVLGAGTQQIIGQLSLILKKLGIGLIAFEDPGYLPAQSSFRDRGFGMTPVPVKADGIVIEKLPTNVKSAVYVSPSNQFPTGALMPIGRRYALLEWAKENGSIIIEDDYDSELRYFGKPVPALKGLDSGENVVYLSSFSSTIFPALKISYVVLPPAMSEIFKSMRADYAQTCSKTEQLSLAYFMADGYYRTHVRKVRALYSQKLALFVSSLKKYAPGFITPINAESGVNILLSVALGSEGCEHSDAAPAETARFLCERAGDIGISVIPVPKSTQEAQQAAANEKAEIGYENKLASKAALVSVYYNRIPLDKIEAAVRELARVWRG